MPRQRVGITRPTLELGWLWGLERIAAYCGVTVKTVRQWHHARTIPWVMVGGAYVIPKGT